MLKFLKSFIYASYGIEVDFSEHRNMIVQALIGILVIIVAFLVRLSAVEISLLLLVISQVLALEMVNTAFERYIDKITPERNKEVGMIKDILAGAVMLSAIFALIIGFIIFYNPIFG